MLVTMKEILDRASAENYGVVAPNISSELDGRVAIEAAEELDAPIILDLSAPMHPDIVSLGLAMQGIMMQARVPVALNLDHGATFRDAIRAIRGGFTSVMVDRSSLPYEENVAQVSEIVRIAHAVNVSVEAELGHVGQGSTYATSGTSMLTDPENAREYIEATGIDCLAVAVGTAHGAYTGTPKLDFERLAAIKKATHNFPLVLHGGSGSGDENLKKACQTGINKVNICNDLMRRVSVEIQAADLTGNKAYNVFEVAREAYRAELKKYIELFGAAGKAWVKAPDGLARDRSIGDK